jgi:ABC-type transport system involved in Fe-S cluster assembly fused permease/ATPase subunit
MEEVEAAAKAAAIHDTIKSFPDGYVPSNERVLH